MPQLVLILEDLFSVIIHDQNAIESGVDLSFKEGGSPTQGVFCSFAVCDIPGVDGHSFRSRVGMAFETSINGRDVDLVDFRYPAFHYLHEMVIAGLAHSLREELPEMSPQHLFAR